LDSQDDIIDEAIGLYRANTFFRNFDIKGGPDRTLIYLTLYIQECLVKLSKLPDMVQGQRLLATHAVLNFALPGDASFPLNSMFEKPATRQDAGIWFG
jgi:actin related protein 2/3 complex subunit 3